MTAIHDRLTALRALVKRLAVRARRARVSTGRGRMVPSVAALSVGVLAMAPSWWWHHLSAVITGPGWRWLPMLFATAGGISLVADAAQRWRRGGAARRRPVAERVPLFGHVAVLLLLAAVVAVVVGTAVWAALGRPHVAVPGTAGSGTVPGSAVAWSVQNTFDAIKIVLAVVAGIGGVVALTVAYRKQDHGEAAEHRENTKLFNDRFGRAADQLGSAQAAVRLAGVYALGGLADDWAEGRQTCIEVLCAYLRMPYTPSPADTTTSSADTTLVGLPLGSTARSDDGSAAREEHQVRHTVLSLIGEHLRPGAGGDLPRWHGHHFNLSGAVIDGGNLRGIDLTAGTVLDLTGATFPSGIVDFTGAEFSDGTVDFTGAVLSGGTVNFIRAVFSGGTVDFTGAGFSGGWVDFDDAEFSGGTVDFGRAVFSGGAVTFASASFSDGAVNFGRARFSGGEVYFTSVGFSGGTITFPRARFSDGTVDFGNAVFSGGAVTFASAGFVGGTVDFTSAQFSDGGVSFAGAVFSGGVVDFASAGFFGGVVNFVGAGFSGGTVEFGDAEFSDGTVNFIRARFSGGTVDLSHPRAWSVPPRGMDGSEPGVSWPSPAHLTNIVGTTAARP